MTAFLSNDPITKDLTYTAFSRQVYFSSTNSINPNQSVDLIAQYIQSKRVAGKPEAVIDRKVRDLEVRLRRIPGMSTSELATVMHVARLQTDLSSVHRPYETASASTSATTTPNASRRPSLDLSMFGFGRRSAPVQPTQADEDERAEQRPDEKRALELKRKAGRKTKWDDEDWFEGPPAYGPA